MSAALECARSHTRQTGRCAARRALTTTCPLARPTSHRPLGSWTRRGASSPGAVKSAPAPSTPRSGPSAALAARLGAHLPGHWALDAQGPPHTLRPLAAHRSRTLQCLAASSRGRSWAAMGSSSPSWRASAMLRSAPPPAILVLQPTTCVCVCVLACLHNPTMWSTCLTAAACCWSAAGVRAGGCVGGRHRARAQRPPERGRCLRDP